MSASGLVLLAVYAVGATTVTGDYLGRGAVAGDNAAPAINALLHLRLTAFGTSQPLMGLTSLLVRLPGVAIAGVVSGGNLLDYRLGAFCCLLAVVPFCLWIVRCRAGATPRLLAASSLGILLLVGPATADGLRGGHPEELLCTLLCLTAVLAAGWEQPWVAGLALGLAVGTKQWALIAVAPTLLAASTHRRRIALTAAAAAVATTAPGLLLNPAAFERAATAVGGTHFVNAGSVWWGVSSALPVGAPVRMLPYGLDRSGATLWVFTAAVCISFAALLLRRRSVNVNPLALLALLALVRCVGDPQPLQYYYTPLIAAVGVWEVVGQSRLPILAAASAIAVAWSFGSGLQLNPDLLNALVISGALALALGLLWRPRRGSHHLDHLQLQ